MRGTIVFNGNIPDERELVRAVGDRLRSSLHDDPEVRSSKKVLLVTAGWCEREFEESHVKEALREVGIEPRFIDGYDANIQNLSAWHAYQDFCREEPALAAAWKERERLIEATRQLYLEKNTFYVTMLRRALEQLQASAPDATLSQVMSDVTRTYSHPPASFDGDRLLAYFLGRDIRDTVDELTRNDDRMVTLLHDLDEHFVEGTGLHHNPAWKRLKERLEERILSANSIFIFGGHLGVLHHTLNFFRLRDAFAEARRRGTCLYTSSAGSLLLCERIIVYNDFPSDFGARREFQLFDRGFRLVRRLQLFPHCMDRIQTDDADNLAYLAYRFQNRTCVGLNEESFLLLEGDSTRSIGTRDGVYVFDPSGGKVRYDGGQGIG